MKVRLVDQFGKVRIIENPLLTFSRNNGPCLETETEAWSLEKCKSWEPFEAGQVELSLAAAA